MLLFGEFQRGSSSTASGGGVAASRPPPPSSLEGDSESEGSEVSGLLEILRDEDEGGRAAFAGSVRDGGEGIGAISMVVVWVAIVLVQ